MKFSAIPEEVIMSKILLIRGKKVLIDKDLAKLYGIPTKRLNEQVKRNIKRFPEHFMFQLSKDEKDNVVAICDHLNKLKYSSSLPYVFTEYGTVMLANVLNSESAIQVSVRIVEIFIKMRELIDVRKEILKRLEKLEIKDNEQDKKIILLFKYLKQLEQTRHEEMDFRKRKKIGYK